MIFSRSALASFAILTTTTLVFFSPFPVNADNVDMSTSFLKQRESALHEEDKKGVQTFDLHHGRDWDEGGSTIEMDEVSRRYMVSLAKE